MVAKQHKRSASVDAQPHLKPHHARPYRKRHVGLLFFSIVALFIVGAVLIGYRGQIIAGLSSSKDFVSSIFPQKQNYAVTVSSSYGFSVSYDQKSFYASAVGADTGSLYVGDQLNQERAYSVVRIAPNLASSATTSTAMSTMTMTVHPEAVAADADLSLVALQDAGIDPAKVTKSAMAQQTISGHSFEKNTWQSNISSKLSPTLRAGFMTYAGLVNGQVFTIVMSLGVTGADASIYTPVLETLTFNGGVAVVASPDAAVVAKIKASRSLLDVITNTQIASAARTVVDLSGSEKIAALYSPAVVKIYNAYCMDISIDGKAYGNGYCGAQSGSGFFVSQDGYVATNGHVASVTAQDLVISDALSQYANKAEPKYLNYLVGLTLLRTSDIPSNSTSAEALGIMVDALYDLDTSRFMATNNVENLLVQVTPKNPDVSALLQATKDRNAYRSSDKNVLKAKLVASDYKANDGYDGFRASDVAIIKVEGRNFPIVKLGSITTVAQGSDLSILGYPGNASNNGIVDANSSAATLTTGKVSSIKNASGGEKKLIETDTTIGHGNSGGPALANNGEVVGIATYTADGSGEGNGVFNYVRDIKDLTDLAQARNIVFDDNSATQAAWQEGIANFYTSHYSKALSHFAVVQLLYPNNSKVAEFTAAAQQRISEGKDVVDFPLVPVLIGSFVILIGIGLGVVFVVRHHKKHMIYTATNTQVGLQDRPVTTVPVQPVVLPQQPSAEGQSEERK